MTTATQRTLMNCQALFSFFEQCPGATVKDAQEWFCWSLSVTRHRAAMLTTEGHLLARVDDSHCWKNSPFRFYVTDKGAPLVEFKELKHRKTPVHIEVDGEVRRYIGNAVQIGMRPDPYALPRGFFSPDQQVAA